MKMVELLALNMYPFAITGKRSKYSAEEIL